MLEILIKIAAKHQYITREKHTTLLNVLYIENISKTTT